MDFDAILFVGCGIQEDIETIASEDNVMTIRMATDDVGSSPGFKASYHAGKAPCCGAITDKRNFLKPQRHWDEI